MGEKHGSHTVATLKEPQKVPHGHLQLGGEAKAEQVDMEENSPGGFSTVGRRSPLCRRGQGQLPKERLNIKKAIPPPPLPPTK